MRVYETSGPEETKELGRRLSENAAPGAVFALTGDLGAGKTMFTQGFAEGLGIGEPVNSPTFTILQVYDDGRLPLYHFDVYRIEDPDEMYEVGFDDYLYGDGVALIEWAEIVEELLPAERVRIFLERDLSKGPDYRKITVSEPGEKIR